MKTVDQKKADAIGKNIRARLEALLQLARDAGVKNPVIYIESEGGVYVLDRDHPDYASPHSTKAAQSAIVLSIRGALPSRTDVGAW